MARMPGAIWLGAHHDNGVMSRYDIFCLHTIVGYAPAHAAHLSVRANGELLQSRDTHYRSAANLDGNHRIIAVETEDHGPAFAGYWKHGSDVPPWTPAQIESLARAAAWAHKEHGIPLVACPDSRPGSRGIAYHRQGCDGNYSNGRVAGGELWSKARGKVCPGDRRIAQVPQIIARARVLAGLDTSQEDDMQPTDPVKDPGGGKWGWVWLNAQQNSVAIRQMVGALQAAVAADKDIDAAEFERMVDEAVARNTPTAAENAAALLPLVEGIAERVVGADNKDLAAEFIRQLRDALPTNEGN